jgi:hypothetical protein
MNDPAAHQALAQEIYVMFCQETGPDEWDWQALANKAFDAADNFQTVSIQRMNPQAATPTEPPTPAPAPATPDPSQTATPAPTDPGVAPTPVTQAAATP